MSIKKFEIKIGFNAEEVKIYLKCFEDTYRKICNIVRKKLEVENYDFSIYDILIREDEIVVFYTKKSENAKSISLKIGKDI